MKIYVNLLQSNFDKFHPHITLFVEGKFKEYFMLYDISEVYLGLTYAAFSPSSITWYRMSSEDLCGPGIVHNEHCMTQAVLSHQYGF